VNAFNYVSYAITLTNTGNDDDSYTVDYSAVLGGASTFTTELFIDANDDGLWDAGDTPVATGASVGLTFLAGTENLVLKVTDNNAEGVLDADDVTVTITATSTVGALPSDSEDYITTGSAADLVITQTPSGGPFDAGDPVTYDVCLTNDGTLTAYNPVYTLPIDAQFNVTGNISVDISYNSGATTTLTAELGGTDTNADGAVVSAGGSLILTLNDVPAGQDACFTYTLTLDSDLVAPITVPSEPVVDYEDDGGNGYPTPDDDSEGGEVAISEAYAVAIVENGATSGSFTTPIDTVFYGFSLNNTGNGTDDFTFSGDDVTLTYEFYVDLDKDGVLDTDELAAGTLGSDTYAGLAYDDTLVWIIATIVVPGTAADEDAYAVTITATSVGDGGVTDTLGPIAITVAIPNMQIVKDVDKANAAPGETLTYSIVVYNHGSGVATNISIEDLIPTNTSYVASSMTYAIGTGSAGPLVDDDGLDQGEYDAGGANGKVTFTVTNLAADPDGAGALQSYVTFTFQVTID